MTSSLSSKNTSSTMSPSTSNSEPLRNAINNSSLLTKLETSTILLRGTKALRTISTSRTLYDAITSASDPRRRQYDKVSTVSDEPPLKRRRSDEDTPKRQRYQRRNSQTAFMLFASVSVSVAAVSFQDEEFSSSFAEETVAGDIDTQHREDEQPPHRES